MPDTFFSPNAPPKTWSITAVGTQLHDLGEIEVKHGVKISIVNLYTDKIGNREVPEKLKQSFRKQSGQRRLNEH